MSDWPDEFPLAATVAINLCVFLSSFRLARRTSGGDMVQRIVDALLITFVVQYVAVGVPGILGILSFGSMVIVAIALCAPMWVLGGARRPEGTAPGAIAGVAAWVLAACVTFVIGEVSAAIVGQAATPPLANDALTYHLPAAATWLQSGRIDLFPTWFHNPANTYSPLAGSMFMAWLIAPMNSDVLARFVQAPALLLVFFGLVQLCRVQGASVTVASLVAAGAVLSRPFVSQSILAKDDLLVAAFFLTCVIGLMRNSAWRFGLSLGVLLSVKFTALLTLPVLLLAVDAPIRARWRVRECTIVVAVVVLLAGPWYLRNLWLTGNPLYPMRLPLLPGMFSTARSAELTSWAGLWGVFVTGYYSTTIWLASVLGASWLGAAALRWRELKNDPLVRLCIVGPPVQIALFILLSPYPEIRFVYPGLLLMFACVAMLPRASAVATIVAIVGMATGFIPHNLQRVIPPAVVSCAASLGAWWMLSKLVPEMRKRIAVAATVVVLGLSGLIYVYWEAFLRRPIDGYIAMCAAAWRVAGYGSLADAWEFVRTLPVDEPVAYTNTHFVYPLMGFDLRRPVVYVPTRRGMRAWTDLPAFVEPLSGETIGPAVTEALHLDTDARQWIEGLRLSNAKYLFVARESQAPELQLVREFPGRFVTVFENDAAAVFEIRR